MPRILDKLDIVSGGTPEILDLGIDYLTLQPGPKQLISKDGFYNAGWFESFEGDYNFEDSQAIGIAKQQWFHVNLESPRFFIICNLADLTKAGNVALLVVDKESGVLFQASETRVFPMNNIRVSENYNFFEDPSSNSFIQVSKNRQEVFISIHVEDIHLTARMRSILGPQFIQASRFQRFRGCLKRFGCLEITDGVLTVGKEIIPLEAGSMGTFDHALGHLRGIQAWNWLAMVGWARCEQTGERTRLGLQIAKDRDKARPMVLNQKYTVWMKDRLIKVPTAEFKYDSDPASRKTSEWEISSSLKEGRWFQLKFRPRFHRREKKYLLVVNADFNQYYGILSGLIHIDGMTWHLEDTFAIAEESLLEF